MFLHLPTKKATFLLTCSSILILCNSSIFKFSILNNPTYVLGLSFMNKSELVWFFLGLRFKTKIICQYWEILTGGILFLFTEYGLCAFLNCQIWSFAQCSSYFRRFGWTLQSRSGTEPKWHVLSFAKKKKKSETYYPVCNFFLDVFSTKFAKIHFTLQNLSSLQNP